MRIVKKIIVPLISFFIVAMVALRANATTHSQELFLQANEFYKKQDYQKAYEQYLHIENKNPYVHYNLGNCAFKQGRLGYALLHWRRAEMDWGIFDREELLANIALAKKRLGLLEVKEKKDAAVNPFAYLVGSCKRVSASLVSFIKAAPLLGLQLLFLFVWGFLFLYVRYLYRRHHTLIVVLLFFSVAMAGGMLAIKYGAMYRSYGVVVAEGRLYSGPGENYQFLGAVKEGQEGEVKRVADDYYKVKIGSMLGWLHQRNFEKI